MQDDIQDDGDDLDDLGLINLFFEDVAEYPDDEGAQEGEDERLVGDDEFHWGSFTFS
jgi:hypothetical protein